MHAVAWVVAWFVLYALWSAVSRVSDPNDLASLKIRHAPAIDTTRFDVYKELDSVSYTAAMSTITEFSRLFQTSFLAETDITQCVTRLHECRAKSMRELHSLRMFLGNDATLDRRMIQSIEDVDAAMARSLADVASRHPSVRLLFGSGVYANDGIRAADDTWS